LPKILLVSRNKLELFEYVQANYYKIKAELAAAKLSALQHNAYSG